MSQYNTFFIPHENGDERQALLNVFLRTHRVLSVNKAVLPEGWSFCVEWMDGAPSAAASGGDIAYRRGERVDYMKVLSPEVFARFSALRVKRKELAAEKGIRAYEILTDAQMAEVAKLESPTLAAIGRIPGIGGSRLNQFGKVLIEVLERAAKTAAEDAPKSAETVEHPVKGETQDELPL